MLSPLGLDKCGLHASGHVAACHPSAHLANNFLCPALENDSLVGNNQILLQTNKKGNYEQQYIRMFLETSQWF